MKKIKLNNIQIPDKESVLIKKRKHHVYLGTATNYYSNRTIAKRKLVELNKQINNILLEINNIYINIFIEYRKVAIIYNEFYNRDTRCSDLILYIEKFFVKATIPGSYENRNFFYVTNVRKIIEFLIEFTNIIIEYLVKKRHFVECNSLKSILARLEILKLEMENFGNELENEIIEDK